MAAHIEVFWGDESNEQSERDFLAELKEDLAKRGISATILVNFFTRSHSRQVDFLVVVTMTISSLAILQSGCRDLNPGPLDPQI